MGDRRSFVRAENIRLGEFLGCGDVVAWGRSYRCGCGFSCTAPADIYDHRCPDGCGNDCCVPEVEADGDE